MLTIDANVWVAAADPRDEFYAVSRAFLLSVAQRRLRIYLPAFARIEIACALARRWQSPAAGQMLADSLVDSAYVVQVPLDTQFLAQALLSGTRALLRAADALYVATAELNQARLVSWDEELVQRAAAITPNDWLAENS
jgi:predicted nucleic acid-binding protein